MALVRRTKNPLVLLPDELIRGEKSIVPACAHDKLRHVPLSDDAIVVRHGNNPFLSRFRFHS